MRAKRKKLVAEQRKHFNELVDVFDAPQPAEVLARLRQIVRSAGLREKEVVLDVGSGVGVLIPLIQASRPSAIFACDVAEKMLQRVHRRYPDVETCQDDIAVLGLATESVDVIFMNAMYGNIADKPAACLNAARMLRPGGRLVVSHPEGRVFVDRLRITSAVLVESLPTREEFLQLLEPLGLHVVRYRDDPNLYLMVAKKGPVRKREPQDTSKPDPEQHNLSRK